jgi:hypothetical protein
MPTESKQDKLDTARRNRMLKRETKKIKALDLDMLRDSTRAVRAISDEQWQAAQEEEGEETP